MIRRREFISLLGSAAAWPLAASAQQSFGVARIGVLFNLSSDDQESMARVGAFLQSLQQLNWTIGRNLHVDYRWSAGDTAALRRQAVELVSLAPDVILVTGSPPLQQLQQATSSVPIVFVQVTDPVGSGFVESLSHPGGNVTGFTSREYGFGAKLLELLKEIAPRVTRAAYLRDSTNPADAGHFGAIQAAATSFGLEVSAIGRRTADEIERTIMDFARIPNGGLIAASGALVNLHRDRIIAVTARHGLPTVYAYPYIAAVGGLVAYGPDTVDPYRHAAAYVDRILKGEKPGDLPIQNPTKFKLVINLKTAKALGLTVPPSLLARADEVIE